MTTERRSSLIVYVGYCILAAAFSAIDAWSNGYSDRFPGSALIGMAFVLGWFSNIPRFRLMTAAFLGYSLVMASWFVVTRPLNLDTSWPMALWYNVAMLAWVSYLVTGAMYFAFHKLTHLGTKPPASN